MKMDNLEGSLRPVHYYWNIPLDRKPWLDSMTLDRMVQISIPPSPPVSLHKVRSNAESCERTFTGRAGGKDRAKIILQYLCNNST